MSNGTFMLPKERIAKATVEALVMNGESNPLAKPGCRSSGPRAAQRYTIAGQPHEKIRGLDNALYGSMERINHHHRKCG